VELGTTAERSLFANLVAPGQSGCKGVGLVDQGVQGYTPPLMAGAVLGWGHEESWIVRARRWGQNQEKGVESMVES
jgi:hypothetical protein